MLRRSASAESNASGGSSSRRRGALARALRWTGLAVLVAVGAVAITVAVIWLQLGPLPLSRAASIRGSWGGLRGSWWRTSASSRAARR
jgi:hypothetical protein